MAGLLSRIFGDIYTSYDDENENNNLIEASSNNLHNYGLGEIQVEYIRGVAELDDYEWFIKIISDKVKSNTLVFIDFNSLKSEEERFKLKSQIKERVIYLNGTCRDFRKDQNLCLVASEDVSALIEDMGFEELSSEKKIKIVKNLELAIDCKTIFENILDAYSNGSTLIVDLSTEDDPNLRRDKFHCLLGASIVMKGNFRSVDNNQLVFVFAPGNAITTFENFG